MPLAAAADEATSGDAVGVEQGTVVAVVEVVGVAAVGVAGVRAGGFGEVGTGVRQREIIKWKMTGCGAPGCS